MNSTWNNNPLATLTPRKTFVEYDQCRVYTITPPRVKIILQPHKTFLPLHIHFINEQKKKKTIADTLNIYLPCKNPSYR